MNRAMFQYEYPFSYYGIPIIKLRRSWDRLNFMIGILNLQKQYLYIEMPPRHFYSTKACQPPQYQEFSRYLYTENQYSHCFLAGAWSYSYLVFAPRTVIGSVILIFIGQRKVHPEQTLRQSKTLWSTVRAQQEPSAMAVTLVVESGNA